MRTIVVVVAAAFAIFTVAGFFAVPLLLRHLAQGSLAAAMHRQVTVGTIRFNPYTLRLSADDLRVGERGGSRDFAKVGQIRLKASWSSVYRMAPILQDLTIEGPAFHVVRTRDQRFNFSDLIESAGAPSEPASSKRFLFALSNIRLNEGQVWFDDQAFHEHHRVDHIQIGVPFIANLPADVEIFVQPLVRMVIDGSPFRIIGMTKPFGSTRESILDIRLKNLDLTRAAAYLAHGLPLRVPKGTLSTKVQVHFMQPQSGPEVRLSGGIVIDGLDVRDASNAPLVSFKRAIATLTDVEPLRQIVILGPIEVKGLVSTFTRNRGGTTNLTPLAAPFAAPKGAAKASAPSALPYFFVGSLDLTDSAVNFTDQGGPAPIALALNAVHIGLKNFATNKQAPPVPFQVQARIGQGSVTMKGSFDLPHSRVTTQAALDKVDLPPLQAFTQPFWAGTIASGKLSAQAQVQTDFAAGRFNVRIQPATASLDTVDLRAPGDAQKPLVFNRLSAALDQLDLASHRAALKELRIDGLHLFVKRDSGGMLSLTSFLRTPTVGRPVVEAGWSYTIQSVAMENIAADVEDDRAPSPIAIQIEPLNLHLKDVSSDLSKPFGLEVDGALKPGSAFKADGTAAITPPAAKLHIVTTKIDLMPAYVYLASRLNAKITRAMLSADGDLEVTDAQDNFRVRYQGDAMLGNLRMRDKLTNEKFLRWSTLGAKRIQADIGSGPPRVEVGDLALSDFYARIILNSDARLNLSDVIAGPRAPTTSLTRAKPEPAVKPPPPATPVKPAQEPSAAPAKAPSGADIKVGRIALQEGHVNFTDNFITPHYTADLTDIAGKIGGFGTRSTKPAEVELQGQINSSAPIDITGSIDPLAAQAFVDIKAKAEGVELTNLSPYSAKYTGYPITKGTLNADVHYLLEHQRLTATNHLFISQLTFGSKVQSPNAINLPIALAVSLLRNPRGEIDLTVPVSGSLNDPQFSIGAVVMQALSNLIMKVVSSPFSVLASVVGASNHQRLDFVEFSPGSATLTPDSISRLSTLAKAMADRPGLRLTISGRVDPRVDRDGLRDAMFDRQVRAQKAKELRERGENVQVASVVLPPEEYDKYLTLAYKQAKFDKPRNFLGLTKSLPPEEMKKLMLANIHVTDDDLKQLAGGRAAAVRRYLSKQVDPVRLAVVASNLNADGIKDKGKTTRVDLSIE